MRSVLSPGADAYDVLACEPVFKPSVTVFYPAKFMKAPLERRQVLLHSRITVVVEGYQQADPSRPLGLLRMRGNWPGDRRAAEKRYEFAPSHLHPEAEDKTS